VGFLEATMLALSYIESKSFGDGKLAEEIEQTTTMETFYYGLYGVSNAFIMHTSELSHLSTSVVIAKVRESIITLIDEAEKDESQYFD
jgi:hypothetical protein